MLDIHRLRIFRSVVASGSIQAAASHLGYSPSAISQHIATLQRELGVTLIEKSGRGIVPTSAGRVLASESDEVIENLARLSSVISDLREGRTGRLTIGYFASAGATWMPAIARTLTDEFPQIVVELTLNELQDSAAPTQVDIDLVAEPLSATGTTPAGYRRRKLIDDPYVVVVPVDHPFASFAEVPLAELANELWVSNDFSYGTCHLIVLSACKAAGFAPRFSVQAQDHHTAIAFVNKGVGITVLPRLATTGMPDGVRAVPIVDPQPLREISMLVKESVEASPAVARALGVLTNLSQALVDESVAAIA
jgi:DNA-binding transcriptional LysR family regulator